MVEGFDACAQEWLADDAAASRNDDALSPASRPYGCGRARDNKPSVLNWNSQRNTRLKRLIETRECRIGMNEDGVEELIRDGRRAIVVLLLVWSLAHENV